jgi:hypothetical protein
MSFQFVYKAKVGQLTSKHEELFVHLNVSGRWRKKAIRLSNGQSFWSSKLEGQGIKFAKGGLQNNIHKYLNVACVI